jgi:hypothetical protein
MKFGNEFWLIIFGNTEVQIYLQWSLFIVFTRSDLSCLTVYADLQFPDVLKAGRCFADALEVHAIQPTSYSAVHVCSFIFM